MTQTKENTASVLTGRAMGSAHGDGTSDSNFSEKAVIAERKHEQSEGRSSRRSRAGKRKKICFVSKNAFLALAETSTSHLGGAEVQQAIVSRCLQQAGHHVSFVTNVFDGRREPEVLDGMQIYKAFDPQDGFPIARFFYPRLYRLWQALKDADADIYYQRCAEYTTGVCALFCRLYRRRFIYSGAHDRDFQRQEGLSLRDRVLYRWGIRHADFIFVQSHQQRSLLQQHLGLDGHVLPNVYPLRQLTTAQGYVLWVASIRDFKRPLLCVEIARRFPHIPFVMIGGRTNGAHRLYDEVSSHGLPNLTFLGFQPLAETERYFDGASLFLNTSTLEGFPNTYLQAWSRGIPTVSFFDPDGVIAKNDLGRVITRVSDVDEWFDQLRTCGDDYRKRVQQFSSANFTPDTYTDKLCSLIEE